MKRRAHDTIVFRIPATFIASRALPTASELAYGVRHGWLAPEDAAALVAARRTAGREISPSEEVLARVASKPASHVAAALQELAAHPGAEASDRFWMFMALAWLLVTRSEFDDPFDAIERLYADFDYPNEMEGIVRFMPAAPGSRVGTAAMEERWAELVRRLHDEFASRGVGGPEPR